MNDTSTPTVAVVAGVVTGDLDPAVDRAALIDALELEYKALKDEQRCRIDRRDHLVYLHLGAITATLAVAGRVPHALLLLPVVAVILGWTHLVIDVAISAGGAYLRTDLGVRLTALIGRPVLGWEAAHRADGRRLQRKILQLVVDVVTFPAAGLVSLGGYLASGRAPLLGVVVAVPIAAAAVGLAVQQALYASGTRRPRTGGRP